MKGDQQSLKLRHITRIEIIQMADMPRYHYDVWADFSDGDSEPLMPCYTVGSGDNAKVQNDYVHGLQAAVEQAQERWGSDHRVELCRYFGAPHRAPLLIQEGSQ